MNERAAVDADPAGLNDLRDGLQREVTRRWTRTAREVRRAIVQHDVLGAGDRNPMTAMPAADRANLFHRWLNERLLTGVAGYDGSWLDPHVEAASARGALRVAMGDDAQQNLGFMVAGPAPSAKACQAASISHLAGICEDVGQRAHDGVASGLLSRARPAQIARLVDQAMGHGLRRTRMLAEHAMTQAHAQATLDGLERRGVTHVGTISGHARRVRDFDPDEPRDDTGRWTSSGSVTPSLAHAGGSEFVSPSVASGLSFDEAHKALGGARQKAMLQVADDIDGALGLKESGRSVIGAWSDGAENSVLATLPEASWDEIRLSAAMKGYVGDQKAVLAFKQADDGDALLYQMHATGSLSDIHRRLLADGLAFHSLAPTVDGADVYVADLDGSAHDGIKRAAEDFGGQATYQRGRAEFIGTAQETGSDRDIRDDARRAYEGLIGQSPVSRGAEVWRRNRDRWSSTLQALRDAEPLIVYLAPYGTRYEDVPLDDAARKTRQPQHPRSGQFAKAHVVARETRRSKRTGQFRVQGLSPEEQRREELREARFGRISGRLDVLTAGDDRVCDICDDISSNGPYRISTARSLIPAHPNCRCLFVAAGTMQDAWAVDYDPGEPRVPEGSAGGGQWTEGNSGLVTGDVEKFRKLKSQWADVNNQLLAYVDRPDSPEAQAEMEKLEAISHEMHALHADPGTLAGLGLPGGPRDVTIIGAGPGGLAASIFGGAEGLDTLVVESNAVAGGQAKYSSRIENFPGFPAGVTGERLTSDMFEQATRLGADTKLGVRVTDLAYDRETGLKHLTLSNGEQIATRSVILAGGVEFRHMSFPGSEGPGVVVGDGKTVTKLSEGGNAVVVGGSNGAAQAALGAATKANHVYLISRSPITKGMSDYQVVAVNNNPKVTVIEGDSVASMERDEAGQPQTIVTAKGQRLPANVLGLFLGSVSETGWLKGQVERDREGRIRTDAKLETAIPGVFAVGDMREGAIGRVGIAVGEGQLALRQAYVYLSGLKEKAVPAADAWLADAAHDDLIRRLFELDRDNPHFGQTIEGVKPRRARVRDFDPDEPRDPAGRWTALAGSTGHYALISSRPVTASGTTAAEKTAAAAQRDVYKTIDMAAMKAAPEQFKANAALFRDGRFYPGMRASELKGSTAEIAEAVKNRMVDNLMFLASKVKTEQPDNFRRWAGWYEGAHRIAEGNAKAYGTDIATASGVIAALSPQNDWNGNVYQAGVVMSAMKDKQALPWDAKMSEKSAAIWKGKRLAMAKQIEGRTLAELSRPMKGDPSDPEEQRSLQLARKGMWIRTENEAHETREHRQVLPEGTFGDLMRTKAGAPTPAKWKSVSAIANAVQAFESRGNASQLSEAMGDRHKVRSFYNNILDPNSPNGDVTIDTHAVGAAWLTPSTSEDVSVYHALNTTPLKADQPAGWVAAKGSAVSGVKGTYGFYAQAYRDAAAKLHIQPRQLQSIVWEAKQRLFSSTQTGTKVKAAVDAVWRRFHNGEIELNEAQREVVKAAHGSVG